MTKRTQPEGTDKNQDISISSNLSGNSTRHPLEQTFKALPIHKSVHWGACLKDLKISFNCVPQGKIKR